MNIAVIAAVGLGTYALRASMFVILGGRTPPPWLRTALSFVGPSALAALVGGLLFTTDGSASVGSVPAIAAAASAFVVVRRSGDVMHALVVGLPVFWVSTALLG